MTLVTARDGSPALVLPNDCSRTDMLELVNTWLHEDNNGFQIPAGEWGYDLLCSLRVIVWDFEKKLDAEGLL